MGVALALETHHRKLAMHGKQHSHRYHRRMTTFFISRHPGAVQWAERQQLRVDRFIPHLDITQVQAGDLLIGTLPVNMAAQVCAKGAQYHHLSLELPVAMRGRELSADDLERLDARLTAFDIRPLA